MKPHLKYILPLLLLFCNVISQAQDDGYQIPSIQLGKTTDSIVAQLKREKIDTIAVYYRVPHESYHLYYKRNKNPYFIYNPDFYDTYIFWLKKHKMFCRKVDCFAVYDSIECPNTAIFTYAINHWDNILCETFITDSGTDRNNQHWEATCFTADARQNSGQIYIGAQESQVGVWRCEIGLDVPDLFYIRNFTSSTNILELIMENEVNALNQKIWQTSQKTYYTRREFLNWKRLHKKEFK